MSNLVGKMSDSTFKPSIAANYYLEATTAGNDVVRSLPKRVSVAPAVSLEADPDDVATNETSTLSWSIQGPFTKASSTGGGLNFNIPTSSPTGTQSPSVTADTTYTLTAENGVGISNSDTAPVTTGPKITSFTVIPNPVTAGRGATFRWAITNLPSGTITLTGPNYSATFPVTQTSVTRNNLQIANEGEYTLRAVNSSNSDDIATVTLDVR